MIKMKKLVSVFMWPALLFSVLLAVVFTCTGSVYADGFGVEGNEITLETTGDSSAEYVAVVDAYGVVTTINEMAGDGLNTISLTIVNDSVEPGTYYVDLGIVVDDADNARRIEAYLPGVKVDVSGNDTTVSLVAGKDLRIAGRSSAGDTEFSTTLTNAGQDGPVTATDNEITFNFSNLQKKVEDKFGSASSKAEILNDIISNGRYAYTILLKSSQVPIGHVSTSSDVSPFSSFDIDTGCGNYGENLAEISGSPITDSDYLTGICYCIRGSYGVGADNYAPAVGEEPVYNGDCDSPGPGPSPGGDEEEPTDEDVTGLDTEDEDAVKEVADKFAADPEAAGKVFNDLIASGETDALNNIALILGKMGDSEEGVDSSSQILSKLAETDDGVDSGSQILARMAETDEGADSASKILSNMGATDEGASSGSKVLAKLAATDDGVVSGSKLLGKMSATDEGAASGGKILGKLGATDEGAETGSKLLGKLAETDDGAASGAKVLDKMAEDTEDTEAIESAAKILRKSNAKTGGKLLAKALPGNAVAILKTTVEQSENLTDEEKKTELEKIKDLTGETVVQNISEYFQEFKEKFGFNMFAADEDEPTIIEQYLNNLDMIEVINKTADGSLSLKKHMDPLASGLYDGSMVDGYLKTMLLGIDDTFTLQVLSESGVLDVNYMNFSLPVAMLDIILKTAEFDGESIREYMKGYYGLSFVDEVGLGVVDVLVAPISYNVDGIVSLLGEDATSMDAEKGYLKYVDPDENEYFASFGWLAGDSAVSSDSKEITNLLVTGSGVADYNFGLEIVYKDGSVQAMPPAVKSVDALFNALSDWMSMGILDNFNLSRDTGVVSLTIDGVQSFFKPDFLVSPLGDSIDEDTIADADYGIIWEGVDVNGDGIVDVRMTTKEGSQILYTISN